MTREDTIRLNELCALIEGEQDTEKLRMLAREFDILLGRKSSTENKPTSAGGQRAA